MDVSTFMNLVVFYGLRILYALVIFVVGRWVAIWLTGVSKRLMERSKIDATLVSFIGNLIYALLLVFVILAALSKLGVNTTSFIAILGAAGLAVGLALQGTLSNVGAAVLIILFRPFKVGDFVEAGGASGVVEEINMFSTILRTGDNKVIIVPNSSIVGSRIVNYSAKDTRRVDLVFGIGYEDDLKLAKETLLEIVKENPKVLDEPAPFVAVSELADSSVNLTLRVWVKSPDYWDVYFSTIERVKLTFDKKGISIPYPQLDIHQK